MKRHISILCVLLLILSLFMFGCNTATDDTATPDTPTTDTETSDPVTDTPQTEPDTGDETVELTLWASPDTDQWVFDFHEQFMNDNPHITLNIIMKESGEDAGNMFYQSVATGDAPDLAIFSPAVMDTVAMAGLVAPLDEYFTSWDEGSYYVQALLDNFTYNGVLYALPYTGSTMMFGYNKALFEAAGLDKPPDTWDEALEYAKILTDPDNNVSGYAILALEWTEWFFQYYVWQAGGDLTKRNEDDTLTLTFTDPAVITAAKYYQELLTSKVAQSDLTMDFGALVQAFAQGKIAMMPFATDWVGWAMEEGAKYEDIGLAPFPAGPSGLRTSSGGVGCWGINATSPKEVQDAAWEYIKAYNSRESIIDYLSWRKNTQGVVNPIVLPRSDMTLSDIGVTDPNMIAAIAAVAADIRFDEFYGKGSVGSYVDMAVQKIIAAPAADPLPIFQEQQDLATNEALDDFNDSILNGG